MKRPSIPFDEFAALETVYRETVEAGQELGSPGYGHPSALTRSLVNAGQIELVSVHGENRIDPHYRARLTAAGVRIVVQGRTNE